MKSLYEQYADLCAALAERECESCGGPAQHVDPDGSTWCFECVEPYGAGKGAALYPGIPNTASVEEVGG